MARHPIDRNDGTPLHHQVAAAIRADIIKGEARPGERLPTSKDIAAVMGVNRNTVLRALRELRDEGVVDFTRGRGVVVTGEPVVTSLRQRVAELVTDARREGVRRKELAAMVLEAP